MRETVTKAFLESRQIHPQPFSHPPGWSWAHQKPGWSGRNCPCEIHAGLSLILCLSSMCCGITLKMLHKRFFVMEQWDVLDTQIKRTHGSHPVLVPAIEPCWFNFSTEIKNIFLTIASFARTSHVICIKILKFQLIFSRN